ETQRLLVLARQSERLGGVVEQGGIRSQLVRGLVLLGGLVELPDGVVRRRFLRQRLRLSGPIVGLRSACSCRDPHRQHNHQQRGRPAKRSNLSDLLARPASVSIGVERKDRRASMRSPALGFFLAALIGWAGYTGGLRPTQLSGRFPIAAKPPPM